MPSCTNKKAPKYKLGYQLFSVNEDMTKAPLATLKAQVDIMDLPLS